MENKQTRILLVDDHRMFLEGIRSLLDEQPDLMICGQAFRAGDVWPTLQRTRPDLLLLDVNIHGSNGIDLGQSIVRDYPPVRVILLTSYNQPKLVDEARKAGLDGYLLKDATTDQLLGCVRTVLSGGTYFDPGVGNPVQGADAFGDDFARRLHLTFREVEIIGLIRAGLTTKQIADRLYLSVETVKTHRKNIHYKLGINKVADLVRFALENGI